MSKIILALAALALAVLVRSGRQILIGVESTEMSAWPSHVIFGLYFAVLVLALQALHRLWSAADDKPGQTLLMLVLVCVCADLVFVNVQEVYHSPDASYGLVVLWDMATFFIWLRSVEAAVVEDRSAFNRSWAVAVAPVLALGREIMFLPYNEPAGRAYVDLFVGNGLVALWPLAVGLRAERGFRAASGRAGMILVFVGCLYWLANATENLLFVAWPPLPHMLHAFAAANGFNLLWLNVGYAAVAVLATVVLLSAAPTIAARFGLRRAPK